jgi:trimeric autotransporter adhesin
MNLARVLPALLLLASLGCDHDRPTETTGPSGWSTMGGGFDGGVTSLAVDGAGLYAAGGFRHAGNVGLPGIAHWDGTRWNAVGSDTVWIGTMAASGGQVVASGHFAHAGAIFVGLALWNGAQWTPMLDGLDGGPALALTVHQGRFVAAGLISQGGDRVIARWETDQWRVLGRTNPGGEVGALCSYRGDLIAGGSFTAIDGVEATHIARWDGTAWHPLGPGLGHATEAGDVVAVLAAGETELYAAGDYDNSGDLPISGVAAWDGSSWRALGGGPSGDLVALGIYDGRVTACGRIGASPLVWQDQVQRWNGTSWEELGGVFQGIREEWVVGPRITDMVIFQGGPCVGGWFTHAGDQRVDGIARWRE